MQKNVMKELTFIFDCSFFLVWIISGNTVAGTFSSIIIMILFIICLFMCVYMWYVYGHGSKVNAEYIF